MSAVDEPVTKMAKLSLFNMRYRTKIAWAEVVVIFLALIRTLTSYYQLAVRPGMSFQPGQVEPIITGSLIAALFCLTLTLLCCFGRYRVMHGVFVLAIVSLVLVKIVLFTG